MIIHGWEFQIASLNEIHFKIVEMMKNKPKEKFWIFPPAQADFRGYYIKYLYSD